MRGRPRGARGVAVRRYAVCAQRSPRPSDEGARTSSRRAPRLGRRLLLERLRLLARARRAPSPASNSARWHDVELRPARSGTPSRSSRRPSRVTPRSRSRCAAPTRQGRARDHLGVLATFARRRPGPVWQSSRRAAAATPAEQAVASSRQELLARPGRIARRRVPAAARRHRCLDAGDAAPTDYGASGAVAGGAGKPYQPIVISLCCDGARA